MHVQEVVRFALARLNALHAILDNSKSTISAFRVQKHVLLALTVEIAVLVN